MRIWIILGGLMVAVLLLTFAACAPSATRPTAMPSYPSAVTARPFVAVAPTTTTTPPPTTTTTTKPSRKATTTRTTTKPKTATKARPKSRDCDADGDVSDCDAKTQAKYRANSAWKKCPDSWDTKRQRCKTSGELQAEWNELSVQERYEEEERAAGKVRCPETDYYVDKPSEC